MEDGWNGMFKDQRRRLWKTVFDDNFIVSYVANLERQQAINLFSHAQIQTV